MVNSSWELGLIKTGRQFLANNHSDDGDENGNDFADGDGIAGDDKHQCSAQIRSRHDR